MPADVSATDRVLKPGRAPSVVGHVAAPEPDSDASFRCPTRQVTAAAHRLLGEVVAVATRDGLVAQSYWLATTLALGAFLKVDCCVQTPCMMVTG